MAKVMISMPDELLTRLDARATRRGTTRSGLLQELATRELDDERSARAREVRRLLDAPARGHGGTAVQDVRRDRSR